MNPAQHLRPALSLLYLLTTLLAVLPIPVFAGLDHRPTYFYDAPKSRREYREFLAAAKQGDSYAQYMTCLALRFGTYVKKNAEQALFWCQASANQGLKQGQNYLGYIYLDGKIVEKDYAKARHWFQLAADQGLRDAQYYLGQLYEYGWGVAKDHAKAVHFYQLAAAQDYYIADKALKSIQSRYRQFEKNLPLARRGDKSAQWDNSVVCLGIYREQVVRAECVEAVGWLTSAAEQGHRLSQEELAEFYLSGKHVAQDYQKALHFFQLAAKSNDFFSSSAHYRIGTIYEEGLGVEKNQAEAIRWYKSAARLGNWRAKEALKRIHWYWRFSWLW